MERIGPVVTSDVNAGEVPAELLKTPGFFRVSQLVPDDQNVLTVGVGTTVDRALELMRENNFDQLPVTTSSGQVIGTFTHRSLAYGLRHLPAKHEVLRAPVDDLVEDLRFVRASQDVSEILHDLEADHAVLVGDEDRLLAVITTADVSRFLWQRTRPFVLLRDIELAIRDLMRSCCTEEQLVEAVVACRAPDDNRTVQRLEELTLSDLLSVLLHGPSYGNYFRLSFGRNRELVSSTLSPVREIRNKVFHFRDEASEAELQCLVEVTTWLRRKIMIRDGAR
ncbi:CBS domain-containing protein [Actinosynnema sp. CA-248983]